MIFDMQQGCTLDNIICFPSCTYAGQPLQSFQIEPTESIQGNTGASTGIEGSVGT